MRLAYCIFIFFIFCSGRAQYTIDMLHINGAKNTKTGSLLKLITTKPGTLLDSISLDNDVALLKRLPSIAHAYYQVTPLSNNTCKVIFGIEENFTIIPYVSLYTSSNSNLAFRIGLQEFNFLGRNMVLGGFYQFDIFNSYGLQFRAPYLFSKNFGLAVNYKDLTTQEPVFFNNSSATYRYNNSGTEISGLYQINYKNKFELGFSAFTEDYQYQSGITSPDVPQILKVKKYLIKALYYYDNITYHYQYLDGFKSNLNLQYAGTSNIESPAFLIGITDVMYFKRMGEKGNWGSRIRVGLSSNNDTPFAPFAIDNNINIRGVGNIIDRGTGTLVFNTEYRHTLIDKNWFILQSNTFIDGGTWRLPGGDLNDFASPDNIRIYPGIGLRLMHKRVFNAVFRIDYGYGITKNASNGIVFGIGQYF